MGEPHVLAYSGIWCFLGLNSVIVNLIRYCFLSYCLCFYLLRCIYFSKFFRCRKKLFCYTLYNKNFFNIIVKHTELMDVEFKLFLFLFDLLFNHYHRILTSILKPILWSFLLELMKLN